MKGDPRQRDEYEERQVEAARRVLIDIGQVLASFADCLVVVGGWVPDLLLPAGDEPHVGSIDVDLALDAAKLGDGRYAELLTLLFDTKRYRRGAKPFQLVVEVDLKDGGGHVPVEVEFLAPKAVRLGSNHPKLIEGFRVLQTESCAAAFQSPIEQKLSGRNVQGARNSVRLRIASISDFLVMKAHAIGGRDKPKDSYDLCYTLENLADGLEALAADWTARATDENVSGAVSILREKFLTMDGFGPQQVVEFYDSDEEDERAFQARNACELVHRLLRLIEGDFPDA